MKWDRYSGLWPLLSRLHLYSVTGASGGLFSFTDQDQKNTKHQFRDLLHQTAVGVTFSYAKTTVHYSKVWPYTNVKVRYKHVLLWNRTRREGRETLFIPGLLEQMHMRQPGICGQQNTAGWPALQADAKYSVKTTQRWMIPQHFAPLTGYTLWMHRQFPINPLEKRESVVNGLLKYFKNIVAVLCFSRITMYTPAQQYGWSQQGNRLRKFRLKSAVDNILGLIFYSFHLKIYSCIYTENVT